ncbi:hypothetical protein BGX21_007977, partial [Mortierella sp. AD011]
MFSEKGISLRDFLLGAFKSQHEGVRRSVGAFYRNSGPAVVIDYWKTNLRHKNYDVAFTKAAAETVIDRAQAEINKITRDSNLEFPAHAVSCEKVAEFDLDAISRKVETLGPIF